MVVSCLLLILSSVMIHRPRPHTLDDSLDTPGILQLTWLLSRSSGILEHFFGVEKPDSKRLREAGMFSVDFSEIEGKGSEVG